MGGTIANWPRPRRHYLSQMSATGRALPNDTPVLLYDGECGLCAGSVQFILRHEPAHRREALRFAPLQGELGLSVRSRHHELAQVDSVVWFEPSPSGGRVRYHSAAGLAVLRHLGGPWRVLAALGWLVPSPLRDAVYRAIARRRFDLVAPACLLPSPEQRERFLA
jgi:predicted DCC family thiol-disulfide oxidoreductase YuxK